MFKNFISKYKHKGSGFGDILGTSICLLSIIIVVVAGVHFFKMMEIKKNINAEVRAALLILEQQGELTADNIDTITASIEKMGFNKDNIVITYNNDNTKADYGKEVSVYVQAKASSKEIGASKFFGKDQYTFVSVLHSISKAAT